MATSSSYLASVECSDQPLDFCFHPSKSTILAAGLVDGTVEIHEMILDDQNDDDELDTIISSTAVHTQLLPSKIKMKEDDNAESNKKRATAASCRAVLFSQDGVNLYSGGSGGDLCSLDTEIVCSFSAHQENLRQKSIKWHTPEASYKSEPIQVLHEVCNSTCSQHPLLVSGDEAGAVRVWDVRLMTSNVGNSSNKSNAATTLCGSSKPTGCVLSWKKHEDYVSCIDQSSDGNYIMASSGDCTLSVYDLRMATTANANKSKQQLHQKTVWRSDDQEDELLSVVTMKHGRKVVCGTGTGVLAVWSWGTWGDVSDRFPMSDCTSGTNSLDALVKVDEDTLLVGCADGRICLVQLQPDEILGYLNSAGSDDSTANHNGLAIEKMSISEDRHFLGSLTHDCNLRIWNARILHDDDDDDVDRSVEDKDNDDINASINEGGKTASSTTTRIAQQKEHQQGSDDEWEDMDEDIDDIDRSDDDDDVDSDDSGDEIPTNSKQTKNKKRAGKLKTANESFFSDL